MRTAVDLSALSDEALIRRARRGDRSPFGELWKRHSRSGMTVARQFTSSLDADDLVAEAFTNILRRVLAGGGPDGAFRPYLYTTIRNVARKWGSSIHDVSVDDIEDVADPARLEDVASFALDKSLTAAAFTSLPARWQSVLWYTEVEGMDPHQVAPILGLSANSVAALAYRAREGLRKAWLQAHVTDAAASGPCRLAIDKLGDYARGGLPGRQRERVAEHLSECTKCSLIADEVNDVSSRIAVVMLPLLLGISAGGGLLASVLAPPSAAMAASFVAAAPVGATAPLVSATIGAGMAGPLAGGLLATPMAVFGSLILATTMTGSTIESTILPEAVSADTVDSAPAALPVDVPNARSVETLVGFWQEREGVGKAGDVATVPENSGVHTGDADDEPEHVVASMSGASAPAETRAVGVPAPVIAVHVPVHVSEQVPVRVPAPVHVPSPVNAVQVPVPVSLAPAPAPAPSVTHIVVLDGEHQFSQAATLDEMLRSKK